MADTNLGEPFVMMGSGKIMSIGGQYIHTKIPVTNNRRDDTIDIAIFQMTGETVSGLLSRGFQFIDETNVLLGYKPDKKDYMLCLGYPGTRTKIDNKSKMVLAQLLALVSKLYTKDLSQIGFPSDFHFYLRYSRNKIFNTLSKKKNMGPKPHGISGSGLWVLSTNAEGNLAPKLVGIFSEYLENRALMVSSKIDLYIDIIRQKFEPTLKNNGVQVDFLD